MTSRFWLTLAAIATAVALLAAAIQAWRADRRDRAHLAAELAATKQLLVAADARQRDRDAQLSHTLSALDAQKRAILTPAQMVSELQKSIPLPAPLTLDQPSLITHTGTTHRAPATSVATQAPNPPSSASGDNAAATSHAAEQASAQPRAPSQVLIPRADLRPLYDFTLDCQACQAKLLVAQNDLADEKAKTAALTKERDDALRIAKGGSAWRRLGRAAKWFAIGAAACAVVARTH